MVNFLLNSGEQYFPTKITSPDDKILYVSLGGWKKWVGLIRVYNIFIKDFFFLLNYVITIQYSAYN